MFSLGLFACIPFLYTCRAVSCLFRCGCCVCTLFVVVCYMRACCVGCVLSIYLCNLCYWLNNIIDLLTALKFFLHCSASRQLSRKTPETVATFAGKFLIDRG